tara:strand:+ start:709 stop:1131 length:423 start_codon:yes stop_codon:yes gene_type:complete
MTTAPNRTRTETIASLSDEQQHHARSIANTLTRAWVSSGVIDAGNAYYTDAAMDAADIMAHAERVHPGVIPGGESVDLVFDWVFYDMGTHLRLRYADTSNARAYWLKGVQASDPSRRHHTLHVTLTRYGAYVTLTAALER